MAAPVVRDVELETPRSGGESSQGRVQEARVSCWTGRAATNCYVVAEFGPTSSYGSTSVQTPTGSFHRLVFGDLTPGATYHFRLKATDPTDAANPTYTQDYGFTQTPVAIPPGPTVTVGAVTAILATSATINWTTGAGCPNGRVVYGTSYAAVMAGGAPTVSDEVGTTPRTTHSDALGGLTTATRYYYRVVQADYNGNTTTSAVQSFVTA
jgi:hypothetical protein